MTVGKWVLLAGTALMSVAPLYGAELTPAKAVDPLERIFIGVPNQLTVPPTFPIEVSTSPQRVAPRVSSLANTPPLKLVTTGDGRIGGTCPPETPAASLPLQYSQRISD